MTQYNATNFDPPAPVAYVTLRNPLNSIEWLEVPMLLDTGADITLVPQQVVEKLGLTMATNQSYELAGFDGNITTAQVVSLELVLCHRIFRGQFLLLDQTWGILGRNILNQLPLLFDGPRLEWREY